MRISDDVLLVHSDSMSVRVVILLSYACCSSDFCPNFSPGSGWATTAVAPVASAVPAQVGPCIHRRLRDVHRKIETLAKRFFTPVTGVLECFHETGPIFVIFF